MQRLIDAVTVAAVVAAICFCTMRGTQKETIPEPPKPDVVVTVPLNEKVAKAFEGDDPDKAQAFGQVYDSVAFMIPKVSVDPKQFQENVSTAVKMIELHDDELRPIVSEHLKPFESITAWDDDTRTKYAAAVQELADACKEVSNP